MSDAESSEEEDEEILTDDENASEVGGSLPAAEVTSGSPTEAAGAVQASEDENSEIRGADELGPEVSEGGSDVPESDVEVSFQSVLCLATYCLEFTLGRLQPFSTTLETNAVVRRTLREACLGEASCSRFLSRREDGEKGQPLWLPYRLLNTLRLLSYECKSPASEQYHVQ